MSEWLGQESRLLLNISKEGCSTAFLGNLCHHSVTFTVKTVSWWLKGASCVSVCAHCLCSWHWAPLKEAWLCLLCIIPSHIYRHWWNPPFPGWTVSALSFSSEERCSSPFIILLDFHWSLSCIYPCLFFTEEPRTEPSMAGVASVVLNRREIAEISCFVFLQSCLLHILSYKATKQPPWWACS